MNEKKNEAVWLFVLFVFLVYEPSMMLLRGWTAKVLWYWFAVPAGLPRLPLSILLGLLLILNVVTAKEPKENSFGNQESLWSALLESTVYRILLCGFVLGEGAIIHLFVTR